MSSRRAFVAGVDGGIAISIGLGVARLLGIPAILEVWLGTIWVDSGRVAWMLGFGMHLVISGAIGVLYGWGFEHLTHRANWRIGALFSLVHVCAVGIAVAALPPIHPRVPEVLMAPGIFMSKLGSIGVVVFVAVHLAYGAVVGAVCRQARRATAETRNRLTIERS